MTTITENAIGYCLHCNESREMTDVTMRGIASGSTFARVSRKGTCVECGGNMNALGSANDPGHPSKIPMPETREIPEPPSECPRCEGMGFLEAKSDMYGNFVSCLICGWQCEAPMAIARKRKPSYRVRYHGPSDALKHMVLSIFTHRGKMYAGMTVQCPWCDTPMRGTNPSHITRTRHHKVRREGYICEVGHAIALFDHQTHYTWR